MQGPEGEFFRIILEKQALRKGLVAFQFFHLFSPNSRPRWSLVNQMKDDPEFWPWIDQKRWFLWLMALDFSSQSFTTSVEESF